MNGELKLEPSVETGKSWPHGERKGGKIGAGPARPPLSDQMREYIGKLAKEEWQDGHREGYKARDRELGGHPGGWAIFIGGAIVGGAIVGIVVRVLA